jgi:rhodanese-related sulfurtransferase
VVGIRPGRFLLYDAAGALLWAGAWITLGYVAADAIGLIVTRATRFGAPLAIGVAAALIAFVVFKYARRRIFLRHLRNARITPIELKRRLAAGDQLVILDLRTALDIETAPYRIPGARPIAPETLEQAHDLIPAGTEVVFYCAEPREATSARAALRLVSNGFQNVHPLSGGLDGWRQAGFAVKRIGIVPSSPVVDSSPR